MTDTKTFVSKDSTSKLSTERRIFSIMLGMANKRRKNHGEVSGKVMDS